MIELNEPHALFMLGVFGYALYFTWNKAADKGFEEGYARACADVAEGNITVSLVPPEDLDDDYNS